MKRKALPWPDCDSTNPAPVPLHHLLADRQPHPPAGVLVPPVQPLEDLEDPLPVLRRDADAVVAHREDPLLTGPLGSDVDARRAVAELQRVADQTSRIVLFVLVVIPVVEGLLSVVDALSLYDLPGGHGSNPGFFR